MSSAAGRSSVRPPSTRSRTWSSSDEAVPDGDRSRAVTASGWLAIGAVIAALAVPGAGPIPIAIAAVGLGLAATSAPRLAAGSAVTPMRPKKGLADRLRWAIPLAIGALAIAIR